MPEGSSDGTGAGMGRSLGDCFCRGLPWANAGSGGLACACCTHYHARRMPLSMCRKLDPIPREHAGDELPGAYNAMDFKHLNVSDEIRSLFQHIGRSADPGTWAGQAVGGHARAQPPSQHMQKQQGHWA